jgi:predicted PurR-regulated permease PerM
VFAFGFLGLFLGPVLLAVGFTLVQDWADNPAPAEPVAPAPAEQAEARAGG